MKNLLTTVKQLTQAARHLYGVAVYVTNGDELTCAVVQVAYNKQRLTLENVWNDVPLNTLHKVVKNNGEIVLSVSGKGIITKSVNQQEDDVSTLFPGLKHAEMSVQKLSNLISVCRKEHIEQIVDRINKQNRLVGQVYCDHGILASLFSLLPNVTEIKACDKNVNYLSEQSISLSKLSDNQAETYLIEDHPLQNKSLLAFAAVYQYLTNTLTVQSVEADKLTENKIDIRYQVKSDKLVKGLLIGAVVFFGVAWYARSRVINEHLELEQILQAGERKIAYLNTLKAQQKKQQQLIALTGGGNVYGIAFYADRLAQTCPEKLTLKELNIHPMKGTLKTGKPPKFSFEKINIAGTVETSSILNNWMKLLKEQYSWISKITVLNYETKKETPEFLIELIVLTHAK